MELNIIDLFCGAGGMSLGFKMEGFTPILALDNWEDAIMTYNFNNENKVGETRDIYDFSNEELQEIAKYNKIVGIIGGPPCQGFSMVGTRDSADERNDLYLEYVRFVKNINPDFFVLENVKGLLTLKKGYFKKDIIERFSKLGYNVTYKVLRACDYGVPQSRERVFFVGLKKERFRNKFFKFPEPTVKKPVTTKDALSDLPSLDNKDNPEKYRSEPKNNFQKLMRGGMNRIYNNELTKHTEKTKRIISMVPDGGGIKDLPEEFYKVRNYNNAFRRMNSKLPSNTIDCGHRNYFHYEENRVPTVRESARIQSFPDSFIFKGSKTSQYTQVGNAVPPLLSKILAYKLKKMLKGENNE
ncbi:MAG: DNA cytosine methyltransferase [Epulopiscium sp.]|nr:DNA cytosine methyltransferase [Candidatus Epulonipiscium sp.]